MTEPMLAKLPPDGLISEWATAYEHANGRPPPKMTYERGWFVMRSPFISRYRRMAVIDMIERLNRRPPTDGGRE